MPKSSRPRKQHRARPVGRPICAQIHRDLILPAYTALTVLQTSSDQGACSDAMSMVVTLVNYIGAACEMQGIEHDDVRLARVALWSVIDRHERVGVYRCAGDELLALRRAVAFADRTIPTMQTHHIEAALLSVANQLGNLE